jgi:4-amino-4-deoxy-L-arabinose transferase-like glycosyltransferase
MIVFSIALTLCLVCYLEKPTSRKRQVACGLLLGLCLLTRTAAILYIPVTLCALVWIWFRDKRSPIFDAIILYGLAFLISGWWYLRNLIYFKDPLFSKALLVHQPWVGMKVPLTLNYLKTVLSKTFTSFFGDLGSLQIGLPPFHLAVYGALLLLGLAGFCFWLCLARKTTGSFQRQAMGLMLIALVGGLTQYTSMNLKFFGVYLGRYLFLVIAPLTIIIFSGLRFLMPSSQRRIFWVGLSILLVTLNLFFCYEVLRPAYADTRLVETAGLSSFCCKTAPVTRNKAIGQNFVSTDDNLCAIRVMFTWKSLPQDGEISFSLWEKDRRDKVLHRQTYPLNKISDSQRLVFIFPPIKKSAGRTYTFSFSSSADDGISLWYDREDRYSRGSQVQNGADTDGDLYFSAYCFTGETPQTIWQGIAPAVVNQDNYITIGEMQFYFDLDEGLRKSTLIHQKLKLLTEVVKRQKPDLPHQDWMVP